ncbi:tetratricopeptide repeat protein [Arcobacter sp. FWKO B]|uniref:tetratricopeptide repeat protein n=1 Tax=Arcobacter sp. FWKO B TaxID=2593672 RepID=UPI0018A69BD2|nr:tetratricopeptide repeat protein [Arcobacter sp. FWKO B]QOG11370.1 sel1 repeat family protein [Arcobacter sp. FWKO B]
MMKIFITVCFFVISLFGSELLKSANEAKEAKDMKKALQLYYQSAQQEGTPEAIYEIGKFFYSGIVVKQNFNKALEYFELSASKGHLESRYAIGIFYFNKKNPYHSYSKAYDVFLELANEGHAPSQNRVGMFLAFGLGMDKDYKEAVQWFQKSADGGYMTGKCHLALMYASGKGVFPNLGRAKMLAEEGYKAKNPVCIQVWDTFKLYNFSEDKGFKPLGNR